MLSRFAARLTYANVVSTLALFMVLGGGAYAATTLPNNSVGTEQIVKDGVLKPDIGEDAVGTTEIKPEGVRSGDVKDFSLRCEDFNEDAPVCQAGPPGQAGLQGERGPQGPPGVEGADGADGASGSPDTPQQVLDKLKQVDGSGSGLDADTVDGVNSAALEEVSSVHVEFNDSQPGDNSFQSTELFSANGVSVTGECAQNLNGGGNTFGRINVDVSGSAYVAVEGQTSTPGFDRQLVNIAANSSQNVVSAGAIPSILTSDDRPLTGAVSVELNDAGTDCSFSGVFTG